MLKLAIKRIGNVVIGKVLKQPESSRNCQQATETVLMTDVMGTKLVHRIVSSQYPKLEVSDLCVRGEEEDKDGIYFSRAYFYENTAEMVIEDIRHLVALYNESYKGVDYAADGFEIIT